jgi:hypothetical protein
MIPQKLDYASLEWPVPARRLPRLAGGGSPQWEMCGQPAPARNYTHGE